MLNPNVMKKARGRIERTFASQGIFDQILKIEEDLEKGEILFFLKSRVKTKKERKMIFKLDIDGNTVDAGRES